MNKSLNIVSVTLFSFAMSYILSVVFHHVGIEMNLITSILILVLTIVFILVPNHFFTSR
ncbi:hypothetical protein [Bacillus changyiensis]|uniref:hypothetical protein n=1 Tax=Bacillus changyiensis TaxID=3004103 RepID=UPI0022E54FE7|nr:hypothetical protein [Bacillus changyiensis]MDA1477599.1 hypothetical protein [Bacillus changyiensis]